MARRERVLIVEGDRMKRELAAGFLEAAGYAVIVAASGEEAFARLRMERGGIDRLVTPPLAGGQVCHAVLADEFRALRGRDALVLDGRGSPAEIAALLQRPAAPARAAA